MPDRTPDPAGDPIDRLRSLSRPGHPMPALPADEVRRRGDRRRRRTQALAAGATLVVLGVVGGGGIALGGLLGERETSPGPAEPSPSTLALPLRTDAPAEFPLEAGWPTGVIDGMATVDPFLTTVEACGTTVDPTGRAVDSRTLSAGGEGESPAFERTLLAFGSVEDAERFVADVRGAAEPCAGDTADGEDRIEVADPAAEDTDEAVRVERFHGEGGEVDAVYRVANGVLVSSVAVPGIPPDLDQAEDAPAVAALRYYAGDDLPSWSGRDPQPGDEETDGAEGADGTDATVRPDELLTVDDLPLRGDRGEAGSFGPWEQIPNTTEPTLACQPESLTSLGAEDASYAEFTALIELPPGTTPDPALADVRDGAVNSGVLAFADDASALAAYEQVAAWIEDCDAPLGGQEVLERRDADAATQDWPGDTPGRTWTRVLSDPAACGGTADQGCDVVRFHRMGVAVRGDRLVLVSSSELGGPLEPAGLEAAGDAVFAAAVQRIVDGS
ncbi:MAG TPA: hypothetical protein VGE77_12640 [Nocardioides sp.]